LTTSKGRRLAEGFLVDAHFEINSGKTKGECTRERDRAAGVRRPAAMRESPSTGGGSESKDCMWKAEKKHLSIFGRQRPADRGVEEEMFGGGEENSGPIVRARDSRKASR